MEASADRVVVAKRGKRRIGPVVAFSGLEGSRKTLLSMEAADLLRKRGWNVKMLRSYPLSLYTPSYNDEKEAVESGPVYSGENGAAGFAFRLFARIVFIADLVLLWLTIRMSGEKGVALVFDRYAHDALVQLRHVGVLGDGEFRFLAGKIPAPDAAFWLRARPELAVREPSKARLEDYEKRTNLYAAISDKAGFHVIDVDNEKRAREEVRGILAYLERDW